MYAHTYVNIYSVSPQPSVQVGAEIPVERYTAYVLGSSGEEIQLSQSRAESTTDPDGGGALPTADQLDPMSLKTTTTTTTTDYTCSHCHGDDETCLGTFSAQPCVDSKDGMEVCRVFVSADAGDGLTVRSNTEAIGT